MRRASNRVVSVTMESNPVAYTSHIKFDEDLLTFYLYSGSSLYAFALTPEQNLEHLYFGPRLSRGFDLRFVSNSSRTLAFNTIQSKDMIGMGAESRPVVALEEDELGKGVRDGLCESLLRTMTIKELALMHKKNRSSDVENVRRRGNLAWRALGHKLVQGSGAPLTDNDINDVILRTKSENTTPSRTPSGTPRSHTPSAGEELSIAGEPADIGFRLRSVSAPDLSSVAAKQIVEDIKR